MRVKSKKKPAKKPAPVPAVRIGAASALTRLEAEEADLFGTYATAKAGGDALEIKVARDAWLKCSESLRKFDLLVEAARKEVGELIPRVDVTRWLENVGSALYFALLSAVAAPLDDRSKVYKALDDAFVSSIQMPGEKLHYTEEDVPQWCYQALFLKRAGRDDFVGPLIQRYRKRALIIEALDRFFEDRDKVDAFLREGIAKLESENPANPKTKRTP